MLTSFARRYLFSKKRTKTINIISWISIAAIAIGTAALIIVLSSYNGIDHYVRNLYSGFYTDIKISAKQGKYFTPAENMIQKLNTHQQVQSVAQCLEEKVMFANGDIQQVANLRGVDEAFLKMTQFNRFRRYGDSVLHNGTPCLLMGIGLANNLRVTENAIAPLSIFAFTGKGNLTTSPSDAYLQNEMYVSGIFSVSDEFDQKYCLTALEQMREVIGKDAELTSIEIQLKPGADAQLFAQQLNTQYASVGLKAETRFQQNKTLYYILRTEKWMTYAVLAFMLLIASFNMVASLSMLALEKQRDVSVLKALGAPNVMVQRIFMSTGIGIGLLGAALGIFLGFIVCFVQQKFNLVKIQGQDLLMQAYPIKMFATDFLLVFATAVFISILASFLPARKAAQSNLSFGRD